MKNQRGIATGWLYLIALIVILGLVSGIVYGVKSYLDGVDERGFQRGKKETEAAYAERDNEQLRTALDRVKQLEDEARAKERAHAIELARIDKQRQQEKADARKQAERDSADVRSGALKLRDPGAPTCPSIGGTGLRPAPGASAGGGDGTAGTDLSAAAAGFLLGLANEADDVARQLASAQAVIVEQITTCNGP